MKQTLVRDTQGCSFGFGEGILVGVDDRPIAEHVVLMGEELGRRLALEVHRVNAVPRLPAPWPGLDPARSDALTVELLDRARRAVEGRVRTILAPSAKQAFDGAGDAGRRGGAAVAEAALVDLVEGYPAEALLLEARRRKAGLLVLGAHEKRHLVDFGNTLRAIYAKSRIPVWVQPGPIAPIRRILAAVDLSEDSLRALGAACLLARAFDAEVRAVECFHVSSVAFAGQIDSSWAMIDFPYAEVARAERERFVKAMETFDWQGVRHTLEFVEAPVVDGLLEQVGETDLVVLGTHGRTGLASVVLGGVAYSVLKRSTKPTLAVPRTDRVFRMDSGSI